MYQLDKRVIEYCEKVEKETLDLIEEMSKIPAPSGKEEKRAEFVKDWFNKIGASDVYVDQALNVICPVDCKDKKEIVVFMAHTDVVFPDLNPLPFNKDDEYYYAPGIGDDTSCLASLMMIAKFVIQNRLTSPYGILFVANSCEEGLGNLKGIRQLMKDYGDKTVGVYTFDGSYTALVNECVGSHRYEIEFTTEGGHSFGAFGNRNAIYAMSKLICDLYNCQIPQKAGKKTTFNVGTVEGGTSVNTIAQQAKMLYEYRSDDRECLQKMKEFFDGCIEKAKKEKLAEIQVKLVGDRPCKGDVDQDKLNKMTDFAVSVSKKYSRLDCNVKSGSTDANIPLSMGILSVCVGSHIAFGAHTREEKLLIKSVVPGLKITAEIILNHFNV